MSREDPFQRCGAQNVPSTRAPPMAGLIVKHWGRLLDGELRSTSTGSGSCAERFGFDALRCPKCGIDDVRRSGLIVRRRLRRALGWWRPLGGDLDAARPAAPRRAAELRTRHVRHAILAIAGFVRSRRRLASVPAG